jgi:hypothetical protein
VAKQTFQLARCGYTLRVIPQNIYNTSAEIKRIEP